LNTQALTGGTLRAIASLGTSGGASTLTTMPNYSMVKVQSFAFRIVQKVKEWIIAIRLEGNILRMKS
jgi:penicillin-binding protein 1A